MAISGDEDVNSLTLDCTIGDRTPLTDVVAKGYPLNIGYAEHKGSIADSPREVNNWKSVYMLDISLYHGMSGGPLMVPNSDIVIGVNVAIRAVKVQNTPFGVDAGWAPIGFATPSASVCDLLAMR